MAHLLSGATPAAASEVKARLAGAGWGFSRQELVDMNSDTFTRIERWFLNLLKAVNYPSRMRATTRLLARVKPGRFLEPNTPTGLTGLFTHPAPRSQLIYLYSSTLEKLKALPESSVYRQSTEALTKHRLKIIESVKPEGFDAWAERARKQITENPEVFKTPGRGVPHDDGKYVKEMREGRSFVTVQLKDEPDERLEEWDGEEDVGTALEATRNVAERERPASETKTIEWETEPPLDRNQISDIETQMASGLIEEVIQIAEGELKLVDVMAANKVWEELEEKPAPGQWEYFERGSHVTKTQSPPT
ncbi:MAG: hypothetical protein M1835_003656 [Candelina submexicana]|nr:MAG: hypothetical protein M1835_003656 [Candelina submexicana]